MDEAGAAAAGVAATLQLLVAEAATLQLLVAEAAQAAQTALKLGAIVP